MTEFSWPWGCPATGDGGPNSFSVDIVSDTNLYLSNIDPANAGVIFWNATPYWKLFAADNLSPGGNTVQVFSGIGMVNGWLYTSNADLFFNVGGGAANATDLIVLRWTAAAQTVRMALVRGPAGGTATVTQTSAIWEVPLWQVHLDAIGNYSSLTDVRQYVRNPTAPVQKLDEMILTAAANTVTFSNIPQCFRHLEIAVNAHGDAGSAQGVYIQFNGDAGANYTEYSLQWQNSVITHGAVAGNSHIGVLGISSSVANGADGGIINILGYSQINRYKIVIADSLILDTGTAVTIVGNTTRGWWLRTDAITRIDLTAQTNNFVAGSIFTLYGKM